MMDVDQLAVNLPYEFRDYLTQNKDKYWYDYSVNRIIEQEEASGDSQEAAEAAQKVQSLDLTAAAVEKQVIEDYRAMFRRAGLKLETAIPVECAYQNVIRRSGEYEGKEYCFLDLGHSSTRIYIYTGDIFETNRDIDTGLALADQAIAEACNVDIHVARSYKHTNYKDCQTLEGCQNIFAEIGSEARKAINFYGFNNRESQLSDAYICGGGIHIPSLGTALGQNIELKFHSANELLKPVLDSEENATAFTAAIGAAIQ